MSPPANHDAFSCCSVLSKMTRFGNPSGHIVPVSSARSNPALDEIPLWEDDRCSSSRLFRGQTQNSYPFDGNYVRTTARGKFDIHMSHFLPRWSDGGSDGECRGSAGAIATPNVFRDSSCWRE